MGPRSRGRARPGQHHRAGAGLPAHELSPAHLRVGEAPGTRALRTPGCCVPQRSKVEENSYPISSCVTALRIDTVGRRWAAGRKVNCIAALLASLTRSHPPQPMPLHFSVFGMLLAVVVGIAAAAWVEHEREVSQRKRRVARVVDEAEAAALWEHGEPAPPAAVPRLEASSADARVAAAVTRAAEAEAEAMQLARALEEARRSALSASDEDAWTELSSTLGENARCSQCRGGVRTHALVPCGHSCCGDCAARGDEACVLCGAAIQYALLLKD